MFLFIGSALSSKSFSQDFDTLRIVSYNLLNYPGSTAATRNPEFSKVMHGLSPDLLVVQEMTSAAGMSGFLTNVLGNVSPAFSSVPFNDGPDTDNGLFYRNDKWEFISASYIRTTLRDIAEYTLRPLHSSEEVRVYSFHLKASTGSSNEQQRLAETTTLRNHITTLPAGTNFIIVGDYNIYSSSEPAWQELTGSKANNNGRSFDPLNLIGTWNNIAFAQYHTQSPRVRSFGGGATGGMDDRFDIILTSSSLTDNILTSTYKAYGNDGNHFNDSINRLPNAAVPDSIANALHTASDHIPVTAKFVFPRAILPVQLAYLNAVMNSLRDSVSVSWRTLSETNNFGYEVQRQTDSISEFASVPNSFVAGHGTTLLPHSYSFSEIAPPPGNVQYRLKQIDLDGTVHYSDAVRIEILTSSPAAQSPTAYVLMRNYPNPFNPSTTIEFSVATSSHATIEVFDLLGRTVASLYDDVAEPGKIARVTFTAETEHGNHLPSGVYFYRLKTNESATSRTASFSRMNKMVLIR